MIGLHFTQLLAANEALKHDAQARNHLIDTFTPTVVDFEKDPALLFDRCP